MTDSPYIRLKDVCVEIPIFHAEYFSLRTSIVKKNKKTLFIDALDSINLNINSGDIIGLYGPNGSGKTTLLRTIAGGYTPSSGSIERLGYINNLIETGIAIDFESSGYDNIKLKLDFLGYDSNKIESKRKEIIEFTELGDAIYNPVRTYSTGMVMRLTFSIATSIPADIILLDEWLSVGDHNFQQKAEDRMKKITSDARILIIASHNIDMLRDICKKIVHLDGGKLSSIEDI
jgi:lipopolysaccharide transport system ATP-binding protein|tara:strand:+ start:162 stop:857 length:696 start_codon:yes stop_codon:yes gene_type:complete